MIESWAQAIACAESAAGGDDESCTRLMAELDPFIDGEAVLDPAAPSHIAYFIPLLEAARLEDLSRKVTARLAHLTLTTRDLNPAQRAALSDKLLILTVDHGNLDAALRLHPLTMLLNSPEVMDLCTQARALANNAALMLRMGNHAPAFDLASAACSRLDTVDASREVLETRLLALSVVLAVQREKHGTPGVEAAESLAGDLEKVSRDMVALLGDEHPLALSAFITLASAELEAAQLAGSRPRMERATEVLAIAAQKAAATHGQQHPQAKAAQAGLAFAEYTTAVHVDPSSERSRVAAEFVRATAAPASRSIRYSAPKGPLAAALPRGHQKPSVPTLEFSVLGPVRAWRGTDEIFMGSPQQRALAAALLLWGGHTATAEELIESIWGENPPDHPKAALRTYASRLRKALGDDAELMVSEADGYAVRSSPATSNIVLDLDVAAAHVFEAEKSEASGDRSRARESYAAALAQWSGEALAGVPGPFAKRHRSRLRGWRLTLLERRIDLDLQLGRHDDVSRELRNLTVEHPLRERFRELLMLALHRSGRQAEALAVFADTRRILVDELGVEPSAELLGLRHRILETQEPPTDSPAPSLSPRAGGPNRSRQPNQSVGREGSARSPIALATVDALGDDLETGTYDRHSPIRPEAGDDGGIVTLDDHSPIGTESAKRDGK